MTSDDISAIKNYHLVSQWAASVSADKAFREITELKGKYKWLDCPESLKFISQMYEDLPKILNIIRLQEKQNAVLRRSEEKLRGYIHANHLADEIILDELNKKFNLGI